MTTAFNRIARAACAAACWFGLVSAVPVGPAADRPADIVLVDGKVLTVDAKDRVLSALAVRDGRIVYVGDDAEARRLVGPATRVIDLHGRAATPGLIDSHAHLLETGLIDLQQIDLSQAVSLADITSAVAARAAKAAPGEWIVGAGWDEGKLPGRAYPTAVDLDAAAPNNPVWLENATGHYGVANRAALKLAGVDAGTPNPPAGTIEHGADGKPAGVLKESAQDLVRRLLPQPTLSERRAAITHMIERLRAEGMTGFKDPSIDAADWAAYISLARDGGLGSNACVLFHTGNTLDAARDTLRLIKSAQAEVKAVPNSPLKVCGAKIFMDGSGAAPTAWMYDDWNRNRTEVIRGFQGYPQVNPAIFRLQVRMFVDADVSVGVHAIGDRSIDWVVDSYAEALRAHSRQGMRLSIIHANTPSPHAIWMMTNLQKRYDSGIPESQPGFAWWLGDIYAANLGVGRSQRLNPLRSYQKAGMVWAGGSDSPVTPIAARYGLWASTARQTLKGSFGATPFGTAEAVDIHAALRSYTIWAARQLFAERYTGSLEVGKSADIAIWDRDPYAVPTAAVKDMVCDLTLFRGRVVFERNAVAASN